MKDFFQSQTNRILVGIIAVLLIGLTYLGAHLNGLNQRVARMTSNENQYLRLNSPNVSPFRSFQRKHGLNPFNDGWDPFSEIDQIQKEMNRMFKDSFGRGRNQFSLFNKQQPFDLETDMRETKTHYLVTMDIPGMDKSNISVDVKNNVLVVSGERNEFNEQNNKNQFFRRERSFGYFSRTVPLPEGVDENSISAEYKKGVLTIKITKKNNVDKKELKAKKISIS